ncbi:hypothetical protein, partial [Ruegeria sp.]|uniref:hypothetical protein n=1 Tax=Ruegeria sp. TaxID=1879320 RepID=UPI00232581A7
DFLCLVVAKRVGHLCPPEHQTVLSGNGECGDFWVRNVTVNLATKNSVMPNESFIAVQKSPGHYPGGSRPA